MSSVVELVPYGGSGADLVVGWCAASPFSSGWVPAEASDPTVVLSGWLTDPDISGYVLVREGRPVAYGELWVETDDDEAELAHLVVDPALRRQGLGRALTEHLVAAARAMGLANIVLRVDPDNVVGISCYAGLGFVRHSPEEEAAFNAGQRAALQWMHLPHSG